MPQSKLNSSTLIPIGVVGSVVMCLLTMIRGFDGQDSKNATDIATLKVEVAALEKRVNDNERRIEKGDERWNRIVDDLGKIKERLGIVEAKSPSK